jgi:hypothetical protein
MVTSEWSHREPIGSVTERSPQRGTHMATYEYTILIGRDEAGPGGGVTWYVNGIAKPVGSELPAILNRMGQEGWRVVGVGDLGFDVRTEIILMRER